MCVALDRFARLSTQQEKLMIPLIHASYRMISSLDEVKTWNQYTLVINPEPYHPSYDSEALCRFVNNSWQLCSVEDIEDSISCGVDHPFFWLNEVEGLCVGSSHRKSYRESLDVESYISEEISMINWDDLIIDATKHLDPSKIAFNARVDLIYKLQWEPSVHWESGIDEGGFVISETISQL